MADREYIARISYGKDSLKMLDVIKSRGLPLDRITTTDVWATDTISANLPPMEQFKARMDQRIWDMYRIEVEHLCALNPDGTKRTYEQMFYHVPQRRSQFVNAERESKFRAGAITGFPVHGTPWCQDLKWKHQGIPWNRGCQMVPEAQAYARCNSGIPSIGTAMVPGGAQIKDTDPKDSQPRYPHGAENSKSTRSKPLFF